MPSAGNRNLLPNAGFEDVTPEGSPVGWQRCVPRPEISPEFFCDDRVVRSGARSLCISGRGKAEAIGSLAGRASGIEEGAYYELSAYFRTADMMAPHECVWLKVTWLREPGDDAAREALLHRVSQEGEWWRIRERVRAPEGATLAEVSLGLRGAPNGRVWWDDVTLSQVPPPALRNVRLATSFLPAAQRTPEAWSAILDRAGEGGADVICLTELAEVIPADPELRPTIPGPATDVLAGFARRYKMLVVASLPEWDGPVCYNTAVIVGRDGSLVGRYRKTHLPQGEAELGITAGDCLPVFDTDIGCVGLQICYDHFFPEVTRALAVQGAEIIFTPIMGDTRANGQIYESVARCRAVDNSVFYVTSIQGTERTRTGRSLIVDPSGTILADTAEVPGVVFADVDLDQAYYEPWLSVREGEFRHLWPKERRPSLYHGLATQPGQSG